MSSLYRRFIPILLLDRRRRLVKTVRFGERTYIGDPFNVIRLFNEKQADELCLLDIDATVDQRAPDIDFLGELASECFMPLTYGGGITSVEQCRKLNRAGIEKFVLGTSALDRTLLRGIAKELGSQAVVVCIDVRGAGNDARCVIRSGGRMLNFKPIDLALQAQEDGAGEIVIQSVDRDGARTGMDLDLIRHISSNCSVPIIAASGAGELNHLVQALAAGASAAASGSAFCFIGRLRAVLISYPNHSQKLAALKTIEVRA
ncbi:MAG: HisA/HisF-related TIM barrel protein [Gammaproteobacteria bacterium]